MTKHRAQKFPIARQTKDLTIVFFLRNGKFFFQKRIILTLFLVSAYITQIISVAASLLRESALDNQKNNISHLRWTNALKLTMEGRGWRKTAAPFDRFPARAEKSVPEGIWNLSRKASGFAVRFLTDSNEIWCRWKLASATLALGHMPATGVSGLDLYVRLSAAQENKYGQAWRWAANAGAMAQTNESKFELSIPPGNHEYMLYLPLYNGVESLEIGTPGKAVIKAGPARPANRAKPVVFYGTSITQGGCASRPGMAYPAILGRRLDVPTINLGFSGSGCMQSPVVDLLGELTPAAYVIDCCPNMSGLLISERTEPLVRALRKGHPRTPIVLVEHAGFQSFFKRNVRPENNVALRAVYTRLVATGDKHLHYVPGNTLYGNDGEATVDGIHATDLGFIRIAGAIYPVLSKALGSRR